VSFLTWSVIVLEVVVQENESLRARNWRCFKRKVQRSGPYSELRKASVYEEAERPEEGGSGKRRSARAPAATAGPALRRLSATGRDGPPEREGPFFLAIEERPIGEATPPA